MNLPVVAFYCRHKGISKCQKVWIGASNRTEGVILNRWQIRCGVIPQLQHQNIYIDASHRSCRSRFKTSKWRVFLGPNNSIQLSYGVQRRTLVSLTFSVEDSQWNQGAVGYVTTWKSNSKTSLTYLRSKPLWICPSE